MLKTTSTEERVSWGRWTRETLESILLEACPIREEGERIAFLSAYFLDTPYLENTLAGGPSTKEVFTVTLGGMDCFTFLDYVEALRLSRDLPGFMENLKKVRYRSGSVSYENRNHFFTDWSESERVRDVTGIIGGTRAVRVEKTLNRKDDSGHLLQGIPEIKRVVHFIPAGAVNEEIPDKLRNGDYVGIYSQLNGLDVSHVGIVIRANKDIILRHASSVAAKVVDEDFPVYLKSKPGMIILRASH